jgi:hypothetical protein
MEVSALVCFLISEEGQIQEKRFEDIRKAVWSIQITGIIQRKLPPLSNNS